MMIKKTISITCYGKSKTYSKSKRKALIKEYRQAMIVVMVLKKNVTRTSICSLKMAAPNVVMSNNYKIEQNGVKLQGW